jgi:lysophospholipase L1-like esterase
MKRLFLLILLILFSCGGGSDSPLVASSPDPLNCSWVQESSAQFMTNPTHGAKMLIGDSITYLLNDDMANQGWVNRGISGNNIGCVQQELYWHILDEKPSEVVIAIGINDARFGRDKDAFILMYGWVIDTLQKNGIKVSVRSIFPCANPCIIMWSPPIPSNAEIIDWDNKLKKLACNKGIAYLNTYPYFDDGTGYIIASYTYDGIHLSVAGIQVYMDNFFKQ